MIRICLCRDIFNISAGYKVCLQGYGLQAKAGRMNGDPEETARLERLRNRIILSYEK